MTAPFLICSRPQRFKLLCVLLWTAFLSAGCLGDVTRSNLSLDEAQGLFPYPICVPAYVPEGIASEPSAIYHAEFDDKQDSSARLQYNKIGSQTLVIEVLQLERAVRRSDFVSREYQNGSLRQLLIWLVGYHGVDEATKQVTTQVTSYQDDRVRWLTEIIEPAELRANMVEWQSGSTYHVVFSRLAVTEVQKIAQSMPECTLKVTPAP